MNAGLYEALGVSAHYARLQRLGAMDKQLTSYLLHRPTAKYNYDLPKLPLALALLDGSMSDSEKAVLHVQMLAVVGDPVMNKLILDARPSASS